MDRIDDDTLTAIRARSKNAYRGEPACQAPVDVRILLAVLDQRPKRVPKRAAGGHARASKLTSKERSAIASKAAKKRWTLAKLLAMKNQEA